MTLSASELRMIATALDSLAAIEAETSVMVDGGNMGNIYISAEELPESLRVVRRQGDDDPGVYAIEIEVP